MKDYNNKVLKYYKAIGEIQSMVSKAKNLDEAVKGCIKIILDACKADDVVVWLAFEGKDILKPFYWICSIDLTSKIHKIGESSVGRVFKSQVSEKFFEYKTELDSGIKNDFSDINIESIITVPLSSKNKNFGCLQIIKRNGKFIEDEADLCELFSLIMALEIEDNTSITSGFIYDKVIVSVKELTKEFTSGEIVTKVLKGVNIDIYEGEFIVFLGESGCGKSTFLNIIGGLDKATSGTFEFLGKDMTKASEKELTKYRRENIGFVFQSYNLMPNLNAKQNLDLIGELVKNPEDSEKILEKVGLSDKMDNYPSELSGGQQQRVSIARSLIKKPKLILADEPTAALDHDTSVMVLSAFEKTARNGTTLVMVTHNEEISKMADRVVKFRGGKVYEVVVNNHILKAEELIW